MEKKKIIIIASIAAGVAIIALVVGLIIYGNYKKSLNNSAELNANLEKLGRSFYEEFYYPHQVTSIEQKNANLKKKEKPTTIESLLKNYENTGISVNLENIAKTSVADKALVESMVNKKTNEKCDVKNTKVTIKPKAPYGAKDYEITTTLECGEFK